MSLSRIYSVAAIYLLSSAASKADPVFLSCDISKAPHDIATGESLAGISVTIERNLDHVEAYITHVLVSGQAESFPPIHYSYTWKNYQNGAIDISWFTSSGDEVDGLHYVAALTHVGDGSYMLTESLPHGRLATFRCDFQAGNAGGH